MDNMPLLHEPGFTEKSPDFARYNKIIYYKNFDFTINRILSKDNGTSITPFNEIFKENMKVEFMKNKDTIREILEKKKTEKLCTIKTSIYNMSITIDWKKTYDNFILLEI